MGFWFFSHSIYVPSPTESFFIVYANNKEFDENMKTNFGENTTRLCRLEIVVLCTGLCGFAPFISILTGYYINVLV